MASPLPPRTGASEFEHWLSSEQDQVEAGRQGARSAANALADLTVSAEVAGGAVRATVTASGGLRDLTIGDAARTWEPQRIARQVLECVQRAQAGLADATRDVLVGAPGGPAVADLTAEQLRKSFPTPATPRPKRRRPDENDDLVPVITTEGWH